MTKKKDEHDNFTPAFTEDTTDDGVTDDEVISNVSSRKPLEPAEFSESLDAIIVEKNTGLSARLNIDLSDYVQSYDDYMSVKERSVLGELNASKPQTFKTAQKKYEAEHAKVTSDLSAAVSDMLWIQLFNTAIQDLSLTQREDIIASPAYIILKKNFRDIMKNSVDEAIQRHYVSEGDYPPAILLNLNIAMHPETDTVSMTLQDNGRGFRREFLERIDTPEKQRKYVKREPVADRDENLYEQNRSEKHESGKKGIALFGGMGKGLNYLMCNVWFLDKIDDTTVHYEHPQQENFYLSFRNAAEGGAVIFLETPLAPLIKKEDYKIGAGQYAEEHSVEMVLPSKPRFGKKKDNSNTAETFAALKKNMHSITHADADSEEEQTPVTDVHQKKSAH